MGGALNKKEKGNEKSKYKFTILTEG